MKGVPNDPAKRAWWRTMNKGRVMSAEFRANLRAVKTRHGHAGGFGQKRSATYRAWAAMITRCTNPRQSKWKYYGGRGITVCDRWRKFDAFLADMGEKPAGWTLDRINVEAGYEPSNCRWATWHTQRINSRHPSMVREDGTTIVPDTGKAIA